MTEPAAPQEKLVSAVAPDGTPILVKASSVPALVRDRGRVMGAEEAKSTQHDLNLESRFNEGTLGGQLERIYAPGLAGAARGLTLGTSDEALVRAADFFGGHDAKDRVRQRLADYQEYDPYGSAFGEGAAIVGGSLLGDEAGLANAPKLISRLGKGIERGAAGLLGEGSAVARVAGRVGGATAAGALEGGIYSAGKTASDAAITDEPLTGEKLVAGFGHGAMYGGALSAGLSGLGAVGGELLAGKRVASKSLGELTAEMPVAPSASGIRPQEPAPTDAIGGFLRKEADVRTIKALGGFAGDLRSMEERVPGGFQRVAQDIRQDVEATTGKSIGFHSRESLNEYAQARQAELGKDLGKMLDGLDAGKTGLAPDAAAFAQRARNELLGPKMLDRGDGTFVAMPGQEKSVAAVEKWLEKVEGAFANRPPTFSEWQKIRVGLDQDAKQAAAKVSPKEKALRQLSRMMEDELMSSGESAAQSMGSAFQAKYQATKALYQSVTKAADLTGRGVARDLANNSFGLTSRMAGTVMGAAGMSAGGPIGGIVAGGASALIGKVIQSHGDQLAADLLSRAATLGQVQKVTGKVTADVARGVSRLVPANDHALAELAGAATSGARATAPMGIKTSGNSRGDYERLSGAISEAVANPVATLDRVTHSLGPISEHVPKTATAAISTTLTGLQYLASKLPPSRADQYSLQPQFQTKIRISDAELSQFMRAAQAVENPLIVLQEAKAGSLSRDHVDAVKAVYPGLYDEMREQVMTSLIHSKTQLPYSKRIQLGILLDIPTDKTLAPAFLQAIQATYSSADKAGEESPPPNVTPPDIAGTVQTATQQAIGSAA